MNGKDLNRTGKPDGIVVVPAWAQAHELFAARELIKYLQAITRTAPALRPGLKSCPRRAMVIADLSHPAASALLPKGIGDGLKHDGFRIKAVKGILYIVSRQASGVVFGVYEYLRRVCGCGFWDYGARGENIPRQDAVPIDGVDILDNPACWYRGLQASVTLENDKAPLMAQVDLMAKNGFTHLLVHIAGSEPEAWDACRTWLLPELRQRGIRLALGHHLFSHLLPEKNYFPDCPALYAQVQRKHTPRAQLHWCLSNPALIETVVQRVAALARDNPEADCIELWPDDADGGGPLCECPQCARLDHPADDEPDPWTAKTGYGRNRRKMRRYLHLANAVAERLAVVAPRVKLSILAYADYVAPPLREVKIHPNIIVCLALWMRCSKHTLMDARCARNAQLRTALEEWLTVVKPEALYLYTYEMGMSTWLGLPFPALRLLHEEWPWLKAKGLGGDHIQYSPSSSAMNAINALAAAKLMRAAAGTWENYLQAYGTGYFGPAAAPMIQLYRNWEQRIQRARTEHLPPDFILLPSVLKTRDVRDDLALCNRALALTEDGVIRWRIERVRAQVNYTAHLLRMPNAWHKRRQGQKLNPQEKRRLRAWFESGSALVRGQMSLGNDLFDCDRLKPPQTL